VEVEVELTGGEAAGVRKEVGGCERFASTLRERTGSITGRSVRVTCAPRK
jgi:hypothetical protein